MYLSKEEHQKLIDKFGEQGTKDRIENVNLYALKIGEKKFQGRYSSHYAVILSWEKTNKEKAQPQSKSDLARQQVEELKRTNPAKARSMGVA